MTLHVILVLTTIALSVAEEETNEILCPEGVADTLLGDRVTLPVTGASKQAHCSHTRAERLGPKDHGKHSQNRMRWRTEEEEKNRCLR